MNPWATAAVGTALVGGACVAYGAGFEVRSYRLRRVDVPVLAPGEPPARVLHLSDLHLRPGQRDKVEWVRRLDSLAPDAVVVTGDFLSHRDAVPVALDALAPLLARPGLFVLGSNDYYAPRLKNPARYLRASSERRILGDPLPWQDLSEGLASAGWHDLSNARAVLKVGTRAWDVRGTDDPHIQRDRYDAVAGPFDSGADLSLGVVHAPYRRVLDRMAADGADLILAGHTHGGQLAIPGVGAIVTNCDLDRRRAKGLHPYNESLLHVSAGVGTSPYAPIRFACPPEATLLTLRPRS